MKTSVATILLAILAAVCTGPRPIRADEPPTGFTPLFNGKDLSGWWGASTEDPRGWDAMGPAAFKKKHDASLLDIAKHWRVENGELVNDGNGLYLTTEKLFRDYELLIDYKTVAKADSGTFSPVVCDGTHRPSRPCRLRRSASVARILTGMRFSSARKSVTG